MSVQYAFPCIAVPFGMFLHHTVYWLAPAIEHVTAHKTSASGAARLRPSEADKGPAAFPRHLEPIEEMGRPYIRD